MKRIVGIAVGILFFGTMLAQVALAGDENNPEFTDDEKDVRMWFFFKGPLANTLFKNIDLLSLWFSEIPEEPNNFYVTFKMRTLRFGFFKTLYSAMWEYNEKTCFAFCEHHLFNKQLNATVGYNENYSEYRYQTNAVADLTNNTITITVPKNNVGSPAMGDVLRNALIGVIFVPNQIKFLYQFPIVSLFAYDEALDGKDYTIQY